LAVSSWLLALCGASRRSAYTSGNPL